MLYLLLCFFSIALSCEESVAKRWFLRESLLEQGALDRETMPMAHFISGESNKISLIKSSIYQVSPLDPGFHSFDVKTDDFNLKISFTAKTYPPTRTAKPKGHDLVNGPCSKEYFMDVFGENCSVGTIKRGEVSIMLCSMPLGYFAIRPNPEFMSFLEKNLDYFMEKASEVYSIYPPHNSYDYGAYRAYGDHYRGYINDAFIILFSRHLKVVPVMPINLIKSSYRRDPDLLVKILNMIRLPEDPQMSPGIKIDDIIETWLIDKRPAIDLDTSN